MRLRAAEPSAVFVIVANVVAKKSLQMALVESDDVVEQIARQLPTPRSATPFCELFCEQVQEAGLHPVQR
jgi:hypothetical protein